MSRQRRRIIFNDDGDAAYPRANPAITEGPQALIDARMPYCVGTQVDSYFWCMNYGDLRAPEAKLPKEVGDPNRVMLDACRKQGFETFVTLRMNDTHDAFSGVTRAFKKAHPEYLIGKDARYPDDSIMRFSWSGLDYGHEQVRAHRLGMIREFCEQYDFDGLELDFSRHPNFFKLGEEERHLDAMTEFVAQTRGILDDIAARSGRPWLLGALVPETPALARKIGLDIETWLKKGFVNLLSTGWGYTPQCAKVEEIIGLGHRYGVPVYPNINASSVEDGHLIMERLRGMASCFFRKGADGVYLFNMFVSPIDPWAEPDDFYPALTEIGEPATLTGTDKLFGMISAAKFPHGAYSSTRSPFPISIVEGPGIDLFVGDDVRRETSQGNIKDLRLITRLTGIEEAEEIAVLVNGVRARETTREQTDKPFVNQYPGHWKEDKGGWILEWSLEAPPLEAGANDIQFKPGPNCRGSVSSKVQEVWLWVRYV